MNKITDEEKFKSLFDEMGIEYSEHRHANNLTHLKCMEGDTKVEGYMCFYTIFEFKNQKFQGMGAWK